MTFVTMRKTLRQPFKQFFGTLANQPRLDIIESLREKPLSVKHICKASGLHQSTASHNLRRLEECGFVTVKQNGRERIYSLNAKTIGPLLNIMHSHMKNNCVHAVHRKVGIKHD